MTAIFEGVYHATVQYQKVLDKHVYIYSDCLDISKEAGQNPGKAQGRRRFAPSGPSWSTSQTSPNGQYGMTMTYGQPGYGQGYWPSYGGPMYGYPPGGRWSPYQFYQTPILPMPYFYG